MTRFDVVAVAKRINQRRQEHDRMNPGQPVRIIPILSRILENDPDYLPARRRKPGKRQRPIVNPSIRSLLLIADALGTTVGDLLGEPWPLSPADRKALVAVVGVIRQLLAQAKAQP